jgi:NitT/TauT family transport system ATP-binding protein
VCCQPLRWSQFFADQIGAFGMKDDDLQAHASSPVTMSPMRAARDGRETFSTVTAAAPTQGQVQAEQVIVFDEVSKDFVTKNNRLRAVENINLSVRKGEILTLVGPSGCGKSTLLNMSAGLFGPTEGRIFYRGTEVHDYNLNVGYMTQSDHLFAWRDTAANIAVPLEIKGLPRAEIRDRVQALIELVGLSGFERNYPAQLSGGMRKRCALARLLAYDPETLLMDEPFAALDAQLRMRMQVEIRDLCRRLGKTAMFVTHDLDEAVAIGDRCAIFCRRPGTIVRILDVPLPPDRDILHLRRNPEYVALTAELWDMLTPNMTEE